MNGSVKVEDFVLEPIAYEMVPMVSKFVLPNLMI